MTPEFLSVEDIIDLHARLIRRYGGVPGIRDRGLLESAVAQPRSAFAGELLHESLLAMAAAYLFHIVRNHPFIDANKRTGLLAALVFLDLNGVSLIEHSDALYDLTISVAEGQCEKDSIVRILRSLLSNP